MCVIISGPKRFAPEDKNAKVEKQPMKAPGINQRGFATDCRHIVPDITPVIKIATAPISGNLPLIQTAIMAERTPDISAKKADFIPSKPCRPEAKYAVQPAKPIQVTKCSDVKDAIRAHIPQHIPVDKDRATIKLIRTPPNI